MTVKEASQLILLALATMPNLQNKDLAPTAKAWAAIMPDVTYTEGKAALIKILRSRKIATLPLPGEILEEIESIRSYNSGERIPADYEAWQEVKRKINEGHLRNFSHPAINQAVNTIGRLELLHGTSDMGYQFMKIYNSILNSMQEQEKNIATMQICCGTHQQITERKKGIQFNEQ